MFALHVDWHFYSLSIHKNQHDLYYTDRFSTTRKNGYDLLIRQLKIKVLCGLAV